MCLVCVPGFRERHVISDFQEYVDEPIGFAPK